MPEMAEIPLARCWDELGNMGVLTTRNLVTDTSPPQVQEEDSLITIFGLAFADFLAMDSPGPKPRAPRKKRPPTSVGSATATNRRTAARSSSRTR